MNGWRGKDKSYSVMLGGGIHMIDMMIRFLNDLPISVKSDSNKIVTKKNKDHLTTQNIFVYIK